MAKGFTMEQIIRMEENKQKALLIKAERMRKLMDQIPNESMS
jgi:hypothetical protein